MKTDSLFYRLFADKPALVFELIGEAVPDAGTYTFGSQEVKQTRFQLDGILTPSPDEPELPIVFVEVMGYRDYRRSFYHGFFTEVSLYLNDFQPLNDWLGVVIFTRRGIDPGLPNHYRHYADSPLLRWVYLDELALDWAAGSLELGVLQLIGMEEELAPEGARGLLERGRGEATDGVDSQRLLELVLTVLVYKFPTLSREEIRQMLGIDELKQTRFYQEMAQEEQEIGRVGERQLMLSRTVPVLLRAGLSIEQIAQQLQVDVEAVRRAAEQNQN